ncbi:MAG: DUF2851 family protein [Ferruginibacter sp.]
MNERLLQYIWQYKYYNSADLRTTDNLPLQIIHPGTYNTNQGPDFINARICFENKVWAGSIEIHIKASEWKAHNHSNDENYNNVILHVVWQQDVETFLPFPTLPLHDRISMLLINRYEELMQSPLFIPCQQHIRVNELIINSWKQRLLIERLQQRATNIEFLLKTNNNNWEETFWVMLARNFGMKVNGEAFENIAGSVSINIILKQHQLIQVEALLFGQAGLLDRKFKDSYPNRLRKEYIFLQKKYNLVKIPYSLFFLRMRPSNFPTLRLAQLAVLINNNKNLFSVVRDMNGIKELEEVLNITANEYWHYHYTFDDQISFCKKKLGAEMIKNVLINTFIPILYQYGYFCNNEKYKVKALYWMESLSKENNSITKGFEALGVENRNAADSQSLIQLKNEYCNYKKCLSCAIGNNILKNNF